MEKSIIKRIYRIVPCRYKFLKDEEEYRLQTNLYTFSLVMMMSDDILRKRER